MRLIKKRKTTQFHVCKNGRISASAFCATICESCMVMWCDTGARSNNQPSQEEQQAAARSGVSRKTSRRNVEAGYSLPHQTTYTRDACGCTHDDIRQWQLESNPVYLKPSWRDQQQKKGNKLVSLTCIDCKELV